MKKDYPEQREDWLHVEYFAKLSKKENPHGFICILCYKTHKPKDCPNKDFRAAEKDTKTLYSNSSAEDGVHYGW